MLIRYNLYKRSEPDKIFNAEMIEVPIENDDYLIQIDRVIQDVLTTHISNLPEVLKFGTAYMGKMEIVNIEITDKDNINLTEEAFRHYMSTILPYLQIIWNQSSNNITEDKKLVKTKNKKK